jgi:predicted restriction endonuclease
MDDRRKPDTHSARGEATTRTWADDAVRAARKTLHTCTVTCDGVTTEHQSVYAGFKAYGLPAGDHIRFRAKAKRDGVAIFEYEGKSYEFRTFLKEPGRARGAPHVTSEAIAQALEAAEHQEGACATLEPIDTEHDGRVRKLRALVMRRGQKEFREALLDAYAGRCAITQCDATAVLEAAHIVPYAGEHTHRQDNGLLLRSDIHTLFDLGLLWIDPASMCVEVAEQLLVTEYAGLRGRALRLPSNLAWHPHRDHLQHHADIARHARTSRG